MATPSAGRTAEPCSLSVSPAVLRPKQLLDGTEQNPTWNPLQPTVNGILRANPSSERPSSLLRVLCPVGQECQAFPRS